VAPEYSTEAKPVEVALGLFLRFLINPFNEKLGGPCRHCGNFYVRKTERKKSVYCSEKCAHRQTSLRANEARRGREQEKGLQRVERAIAKWLAERTSKPWKEWVSNETPYKKHWLTRAVRNKELIEPTFVMSRKGS
jgi:hypothetical protein